MNYIIVELQTNNNVTAVVTPVTYATRDEAESAFHLKLSSAYSSTVQEHAVSMIASDGRVVRSECHHYTAPAPAPEPEPESEPEGI